MAKLLRTCFLFLLILSLVTVTEAGDLNQYRVILKSEQDLPNGKLIERPNGRFSLSMEIPSIKDANELSFELNFDENVLELDKIATQPDGNRQAAGVEISNKTIKIKMNDNPADKLYCVFKVIKKGETEIKLNDGEIIMADGSAKPLGHEGNIPVVTNVEDSSWSRLKAIFND